MISVCLFLDYCPSLCWRLSACLLTITVHRLIIVSACSLWLLRLPCLSAASHDLFASLPEQCTVLLCFLFDVALSFCGYTLKKKKNCIFFILNAGYKWQVNRSLACAFFPPVSASAFISVIQFLILLQSRQSDNSITHRPRTTKRIPVQAVCGDGTDRGTSPLTDRWK